MRMEDPTHLERMGRELKCPICLSLLNSAVSLTCNHVFCNTCIVKSMKSASACPVCKLPFTRREVRPAPHMDNLVTVYRSMELASGISMFVTQNPPLAKSSDEEGQCEGDADRGKGDAGGTHQNHAQKRKSINRKGSRKKAMTSKKCPGPDIAKPSFPAKKRVQVPQNPLSETPLKNSSFGDSLCEINKEGTEKDTVVANERPLQSERDVPVLSPFFWLREDEGGDKLSQQTIGDQLIDDGPTPIPPSFSDLKDSDDENPPKVTSSDEVQNKAFVDLFDSEMFEWTQRPCSPELFSTPVKMKLQAPDNGEIDENQEDLVAASQEFERNQSSAAADNTKFQNHKEGNRLTVVLPPSVASQFGSSADINGIKKSTKRGRKTREKARQEQIVEQQDPIDGMNVDSNRSLEVTEDQSLDNKRKSSNLGKTSKRGKKVCFNTGTNPTPQHACIVSNISGVLGDGETNIAKNSCTSPCKQEAKKHAAGEIAGKCQRKRSEKQKLDYVQDLAEELSSMQNQTNEFSGSASSILCLQMDNNGKASTCRQRKGKISQKSISCNGELRRNKKLKLSSDSISKTKTGEEIQPNESIHDVNILNDTSKEKLSPLMHEPVLQKCESDAKKYQCAFCLSSEESEASGPMIHYYGGKPVSANYEGGSKVTHSHRNCTEWAPNVYFEDDKTVNLEAEISRSRRIKCSFCGLKGAALGCYEKSCRRSFHVPCAKWTSQCRWDMENFVMLCPLHASSLLPCESSRSLDRNNKCKAREGKSLACKHGTTNQNQTAHGSFKKIVLSCSALSVQERGVVSEFERVSKVTVLKKWDSSVTHVIASTDENGACRRTLKVLIGILEGKWILNIEWIKACMKGMEPVDEERYEINVDIHGIRDGPRLGRLRALNKQPKLFDGFKFYFMGDFIPSYKGYLQDLVTAAGGVILNRKPVSGDQNTMSPDMHPCQTLIIYSLELPDKCSPLKRDTIFSQRRCDAEVLASSTGSKVASNTWILNSIAACKLQSLAQ